MDVGVGAGVGVGTGVGVGAPVSGGIRQQGDKRQRAQPADRPRRSTAAGACIAITSSERAMVPSEHHASRPHSGAGAKRRDGSWGPTGCRPGRDDDAPVSSVPRASGNAAAGLSCPCGPRSGRTGQAACRSSCHAPICSRMSGRSLKKMLPGSGPWSDSRGAAARSRRSAGRPAGRRRCLDRGCSSGSGRRPDSGGGGPSPGSAPRRR